MINGKKRRAAMTVGLGLMITLGFWALISQAAPGNPTLEPRPNSHTAPLSAVVSITYDEAISAATVTSHTFAVHATQSGLLTETHGVLEDGHTIIVTPTRPFHQGELVYAIATTGTLNISSTGPLSATQWQFRAGQVTTRCVGGFSDVGAGLAGVHHSTAAWGDYDNDGDLDILLAGYSDAGAITRVYRNDGQGPQRNFNDIGAEFLGVQDGAVAWGDYDGDGDLDILLIGQGSTGRVTLVYRNDGAGSFSQVDVGLPGFYWGSAAWGDYDSDGDLDILLTGYSDLTRRTTKLFRNDGAATAMGQNPAWTFTDIEAGLKGTRWGTTAWGDYDNDGDLDILLTGYGGGGKDVTSIYRNNGSSAGWTFTAIDARLTSVEGSAVAWADYDNDGDLDILLSGFVVTDSVRVTRLYRNDGPGPPRDWTFTDVDADLADVAYGSVAWGDYDNDGDLDILLTGDDSDGALISRIYRNGGSTAGWTFDELDVGLADTAYGAVAWGDYDNDGDLDILLSGYDRLSRIYRNDDCGPDPALVKTAITPSGGNGGSAQIPGVAAGDAITYQVAFVNNGTLTATHVVITDAVPMEHLESVSYTVSSGATITDIDTDVPYAWKVAPLPPDSSGVITVTGQLRADLPDGTAITNTATITASSDANPANNVSSVSVVIGTNPDGHIYLPLVTRSSTAGAEIAERDSSAAELHATPVEIDAAIQDGLAWLANSQELDGSWNEHTAITCFALSALQQHAYDLGFHTWDAPGYAYRDHIVQGWQYVFTPTRTAKVAPLPVQPAGDPDSNGNGYGVSFRYDDRHHVYAEGVCLMALEASGTPHRENDGGLDYDADGKTDTFLSLAQEGVDWTALAQLDGGNGRGNWYYTAEDNGSGNPDQSNGGFAVLGLAAAEAMGATVPDFVRSELDYAIDYIQCSNAGSDYGGAGYSSPCSYVNEYKSGFLALQMGFYGDLPSVQRFQDVLDYVDRHWQDENNNPGWGYDSNPSAYLAMFAVAKGLRYNGITQVDTDSDSARDDAWFNQEPPTTPAQDFATALVGQQESDGSWPFCDWGDVVACTTWALLTLQNQAPTPPNQPDAWVRAVPAGDFVGEGVYNTDGTAQTVSAEASVSQAAIYQVRLENDGVVTQSFTITGTGSAGVWSVAYRDDGGDDITAQVNGAGWSSGNLAFGEAVSLSIQVAPDTMPGDGHGFSVLLQAISNGEPQRVDAVRANTGVKAAASTFLPLVIRSDVNLNRSEEDVKQ